MRATTKRTAAFSAAIAVVALTGAGCTQATNEKAGQTTGSPTSSVTSAIAAGPTTTASSSTQIAGANGVEYTVEGPILAKYESLDAATRKSLGQPTGNEDKHPDGGFQEFDGGAICVHGAGSFVILGKIRDKWNELGGMEGKLGFPTSDETDTGDGGKKSTFEHGTITWKPGDTQANVVYS
ncbi:MAG: hypothetical protein WB785_16370 [Mycobacterium sp.]|uniref:LGFP repeat-containing protein n=1 Tax=Mycobacterium sp. TaxID=1785 RepID=UPI003C5F0D9A